MSEQNDRAFRELLKKGMGPADSELKRDLWPQMLRRMDERFIPVPWFDWALLGGVVALIAAFPATISMLLYCL